MPLARYQRRMHRTCTGQYMLLAAAVKTTLGCRGHGAFQRPFASAAHLDSFIIAGC
jgi:hypothetical protein